MSPGSADSYLCAGKISSDLCLLRTAEYDVTSADKSGRWAAGGGRWTVGGAVGSSAAGIYQPAARRQPGAACR